MFRPAPLNTTFFTASIIGFFLSIFYIWKYSIPWATAFATIFTIMFIASMISMTYRK